MAIYKSEALLNRLREKGASRRDAMSNTESSDGTMLLTYKLTFGDGMQREFGIPLHRKTLDLVKDPKRSHPQWAELKCSQCPNCPLEESQHPFCPIAVNLTDVVGFFSSSFSYEEVDVVITTEERSYMKRITLGCVLASLIGIYMVTSGCPIMDKLRPMVRFHLPFATIEETTYRVISMYLLAQYFLSKRGKEPDWELQKLADTYEDICIVNESFCARLRYAVIKDASLNALANLDILAQFVSMSINERMLDEIEDLFSAHLT
jgi:hypothetical protein